MTQRTHTHVGNCQICGREQAVDNVTGRLAKHGYTVEFSQFNGTCHGSSRKPLQVERLFTDRLCVELLADANEADAQAQLARQGTAWPHNVVQYDDSKYPRAVRDAKFNEVMIGWAAANTYSRVQGLKVYIAGLEGKARFYRSHAAVMEQLANKLHGTALVAAEVEQRAKSTRKANRAAAGERREKLYVLGRSFERGYDEIEAIYLALPREGGDPYGKRLSTAAQDATYGGVSYPHQWTEKRRAAVLSAWAGNEAVAAIVAKLDQIAAEHKAVKESA